MAIATLTLIIWSTQIRNWHVYAFTFPPSYIEWSHNARKYICRCGHPWITCTHLSQVGRNLAALSPSILYSAWAPFSCLFSFPSLLSRLFEVLLLSFPLSSGFAWRRCYFFFLRWFFGHSTLSPLLWAWVVSLHHVFWLYELAWSADSYIVQTKSRVRSRPSLHLWTKTKFVSVLTSAARAFWPHSSRGLSLRTMFYAEFTSLRFSKVSLDRGYFDVHWAFTYLECWVIQ